MKITTYKKTLPTTYVLGASPVFELLTAYPKRCLEVLVSDDYDDGGKLAALCARLNVPLTLNRRAVTMLSPKDNCYVVGVLSKSAAVLDASTDHIVLVEPSDMGNLGTVIRTAAAFGIRQVVVIGTLDVHHPKVIRASMGAFFHCDTVVCESFEQYRAVCGERDYFPFILQAQTGLTAAARSDKPLSLVFGNEARGLPESFLTVGTPLKIEQSEHVDSLSLPMAVTVAAFWFGRLS